MLKRLGLTILALVMSLMLVPVVPPTAVAETTDTDTSTNESTEYVEGQAIVCFKSVDGMSGLSTLSDDGFEYEVVLETDATDATSAQGLSTQSDDEGLTLSVVKSESLSTDEIVTQMEARPDVEFAEPDYLIATGWTDEATTQTDDDASVTEASDDTTQTFTPLGDYEQFQWGLDNEGGFLDGTAGSDIDNSDGLKGNDNVVVAVIDSGIDSTNANLANQLIDLSGYGSLVKDTGAGTYGYNAYSSSATADHTQLYDTVGHGTHVAGIIGADGGATGAGAHGVMQDVTLLCVKVCDSNHQDYIPESSLVRGFGWLINAKEKYGVNVCAANLSIGSNTGYKSDRLGFQALEDAGIILCNSSGNDSQDTALYSDMSSLARSGATVVVDAMDVDGAKANYSNYGIYTDVFAPGTDIYSTISSKASMSFNSFRAQADGTSYIYDGFEGEGKSDVTQVANPTVTSQTTGLYTYDATATDYKGAAVTEESSKYHFLGTSSLTLDVPAEGTTLVSDVFDLSSITDWSQICAGLSIKAEHGGSVYIDFRLKDGTFTSQFIKGYAGAVWDATSAGTSHALSNIENLDTEHFQMKISIVPYMEGTAPGTVYLDSLGVGSGFAGYAFMSGTSMASPMATGVTGLLCAEFEGKEASARIAARVVGGTTTTESFDGQCRSNGMVDVHKAYTNPDPVIQTTSWKDGKLVLSGWFLGAAGTVTVGGSAATVEGWTADTESTIGTITIDVPDGMKGCQKIVVTSSDGRSGSLTKLVQQSMTDFEELSVPQAAANTAYDLAKSAIPVNSGDMLSLVTLSSDVTDANLPSLGIWTYDTAAQAAGKDPWTENSATLYLDHTDLELYNACYADGKIWALVHEPYSLQMFFSGDLPYTTLASFDMKTQTWTQYKDIAYTSASILISWNDQPYLFGGFIKGDTMPVVSKALNRVNCSTGAYTQVATIESLPDIYFTVSGDDLIGMDSSNTYVVDLSGIDENDPTKVLPEKTYDPPTNLGAAQDTSAALCGTAAGAVFSGFGTYTGTIDTWFFNKTTGAWTSSDQRLSYETPLSVAGTIYGNALYVWGKSNDLSNVTFFRKLSLHEVSATVTPEGGGTVKNTGAVQDGGSVTLTATPAKGYYFLRWMEGTKELGSDTTLTLSDITTDRTVTAEFAVDKWSRLAGDSRYDTMAAVVDEGFASGSCTTAVLATGRDFPDALAANGLAGLYGAPVVLIDGKLTDPDAISSSKAFSELERLGVQNVIITGGSSSMSDAIMNALIAKYGTTHVSRASGADRIGTSLAVYKAGKDVVHGADTGWGKTVVIATGANYADALSISPFSYATSSPIILTDNNGNLTDAAKATIASGGFEHAVIVGGTSVVTDATQMWLTTKLGSSEVVRLSGKGRYSTSMAIADFSCGLSTYADYLTKFGYTALTFEYPCVATGQASPDGLAGGALCGKRNSVLLLADDSTKTSDAECMLSLFALVRNKNSIVSAYVLGGENSISADLYNTLSATTR